MTQCCKSCGGIEVLCVLCGLCTDCHEHEMVILREDPELVHSAEGVLQFLRHLEECPSYTNIAGECTCGARDADARLMRALRTTG